MRSALFFFVSIFLFVGCNAPTTNSAAPESSTSSESIQAEIAIEEEGDTQESDETVNEGNEDEYMIALPDAPTRTQRPRRTRTPTRTPRPIVLSEPEDFDGRSRYTGELVDDPALLERRPLMCKVPNYDPIYVRPQSGMNAADIVFEEPIEGIFTRFVLMFQSQTPETIGPIRSARLVDIDLVEMYDGILCYSGGAEGVNKIIARSNIRRQLLPYYTDTGGYERVDNGKPLEYTLYVTDPEEMWNVMDQFEQRNVPPRSSSQTTFSNIPPENGSPRPYLSLNYADWELVEWRYNPDDNQYYRWADGEEMIDANDGEQVSVSNVVMVHAFTHSRDPLCIESTPTSDLDRTDLNEDGMKVECFQWAMETLFEDRGYMILLRDGMAWTGEWRREGDVAMLTFYDTDGNVLPLQIGQTWVQIVPTFFDFNETYQFEDPN